MKKVLVLIFVVIAIFVVVYAINSNKDKGNIITENQEGKTLTYVTLDINPSIELAIDENNIVADSVTLNEDADIAYSDLNLVGQTLESATEIIIDTAIELGHITEISDTNAVNVTTYAEDESRREGLNKLIVNKLNSYFETRKIYALVVENGLNDELKTKADSYSIPYGKMLLVSRAMQLDSTLVESDLVNLTVKEIQSNIKTQAIARREEFKATVNEKRQEFIDVKKQKIADAKEKLQKDKDEFLKSTQDTSGLTTEQKQTIIEERKDRIKEEIQDVKQQLNQSPNTIKEEVKQGVRNKYLSGKDQ